MADKTTLPPPAYFLSLSLENVRSFGEKQVISFARPDGRPAQWTIILGDNGVGKTTVLRSLGYFMTFEEAQRYENHEIYASINLPHHTYLLPIRKDGAAISSISCDCASGTGLNDSKLVPAAPSEVKPFIQYFPSVSTKGGHDAAINLNAGVLRGLTCYGYGASRTTGSSTLDEITESVDFCRSLYNDHADLLNAEEWFLQTDYRIKSNPLDQRTKLNHAQLRKALLQLLDEVEDLRVSPATQAASPKQGLQLKTPYGWVRLRDMSLGYQTLAVWLTDFASKLFIRYPDSPNPLEEPAIVLIDEIDLHLHPSWQRKLIKFLSDIFKNTQFIATAHSPLVVQAATDADANVVLLKREGDQTIVHQNPEDVRGWRLDQILTSELFGLETARSLETEQKLQRRAELLTKGKRTAAEKKELDTLTRELDAEPLGETPSEREVNAVLQELRQRLRPKDSDPKAA